MLLERRCWLPTSGERCNPKTDRYNVPTPEKGETVKEEEPAEDRESIITSFVSELPQELQNQVNEYINHRIRELEAVDRCE